MSLASFAYEKLAVDIFCLGAAASFDGGMFILIQRFQTTSPTLYLESSLKCLPSDKKRNTFQVHIHVWTMVSGRGRRRPDRPYDTRGWAGGCDDVRGVVHHGHTETANRLSSVDLRIVTA